MKHLVTACGLQILVDDEDYEYLAQFRWYRLVSRNTTYARTGINGKTKVLTHVLSTKYKWNLNGKVVDHINKNGLDNRKQNLNVVTQQQNISKDAGYKKSSSKLRGVSKNKDKWCARLHIKGMNYYLGVFNTEEEAYQAYLNKRNEVGY